MLSTCRGGPGLCPQPRFVQYVSSEFGLRDTTVRLSISEGNLKEREDINHNAELGM
jgi:hypothetical protein